jgi:hypothetical protein
MTRHSFTTPLAALLFALLTACLYIGCHTNAPPTSEAAATRDQRVTDAQVALAQIVEDIEDSRHWSIVRDEEDQATIARLNAEIRDLRARLTQAGVPATAPIGEPDGQIIRVNSATGEVYITLTAKDQITPGMTFTVHDPRTGVRYTNEEAARGKGTLEVVTVGEAMSLCRITQTTPGQAIQAGDLIANLAYHNDRARKAHFGRRGWR